MRGEALRRAIDPDMPTELLRTRKRFRSATEPHERGACFVGAVLTPTWIAIKPPSPTCCDSRRAVQAGCQAADCIPTWRARVTAEDCISQTDLGMVVRAFDYLPPVDVTFGDVVRAIVTSDHSLYPMNPLGLRSNLIEALRRRGVYPERVYSGSPTAR